MVGFRICPQLINSPLLVNPNVSSFPLIFRQHFSILARGRERHIFSPMAKTLLHPLRGLLIAQFCGAFNDNAWKLMVALLAIRQATAQLTPGPEMETAAQTQTAITFIIFTL